MQCNLLADMLDLSNLDPHMILIVFLPALLFESAFAMDVAFFYGQVRRGTGGGASSRAGRVSVCVWVSAVRVWAACGPHARVRGAVAASPVVTPSSAHSPAITCALHQAAWDFSYQSRLSTVLSFPLCDRTASVATASTASTAQLGEIITLAFPGVLTASLLTACFLLGLFPKWSFWACWMLGTILSATDPVAVVALLKELGVPKGAPPPARMEPPRLSLPP